MTGKILEPNRSTLKKPEPNRPAEEGSDLANGMFSCLRTNQPNNATRRPRLNTKNYLENGIFRWGSPNETKNKTKDPSFPPRASSRAVVAGVSCLVVAMIGGQLVLTLRRKYRVQGGRTKGL